jgi:UDP-N-acetylmuramyl pentapeptide phosphotransferase/UDP-N-acetylglucosamine-1-phosphate transferase
MSIMSYPLMDVLRVFIIRLAKGKSPLSADKNHIHHNFERLGIGHAKTSLILFGFSIIVVMFQLLTQLVFNINNPTILLFIQLVFACSIMWIIYILVKKFQKNHI